MSCRVGAAPEEFYLLPASFLKSGEDPEIVSGVREKIIILFFPFSLLGGRLGVSGRDYHFCLSESSTFHKVSTFSRIGRRGSLLSEALEQIFLSHPITPKPLFGI